MIFSVELISTLSTDLLFTQVASSCQIVSHTREYTGIITIMAESTTIETKGATQRSCLPKVYIIDCINIINSLVMAHTIDYTE